MNRRDFIKATSLSTVAALAPDSSLIMGAESISHNTEDSSIRIQDNRIYVETKTLNAIIDRGIIVSLKCKAKGMEYIDDSEDNKDKALQLVFSHNQIVNLASETSESVTTRQISKNKVECVFHTWNGDGVLFISTDDNSGDLIIEPSAYSSRPGLLACRWNLVNIKKSLNLVAPFYQGVKLKLDDPLLKNTRWKWPFSWEAGLVIFESDSCGFWVHTEDNNYKFKALQTAMEDAYTIGFDSEAFGPVDNNLSAGGILWRINTFTGDWHVPAKKYKDWYWKAYDLHLEEQKRPKWLNNIKFAVSWCPGEVDVLDAIAKKINPEKVLLHYPNWRTDAYDENYPTYIPSDNAKNFIKKAQKMGFHVMPHFNSIDMDPSNPVFHQVRDFSYRDIESKVIQGWAWDNNQSINPPESNLGLINNQNKKVMVKIHPGLGMWRSILAESIQKAVSELSLDSVFIDVTLCIWNIHNSIVDSTATTEGMNKLIKYISCINNNLAVGGEGLNEITAQAQSFAQVHLFKHGVEGYERSGNCDLNNFLFGQICRSFGYSGLGGNNVEESLRMKVHLNHGAIPTITISSASEINTPNAAVAEMFKLANRNN